MRTKLLVLLTASAICATSTVTANHKSDGIYQGKFRQVGGGVVANFVVLIYEKQISAQVVTGATTIGWMDPQYSKIKNNGKFRGKTSKTMAQFKSVGRVRNNGRIVGTSIGPGPTYRFVAKK